MTLLFAKLNIYGVIMHNLKYKEIIMQLRRHKQRTIYIEHDELDDLLAYCSKSEIQLYSLILKSAMMNPTIDFYTNNNLAKLMYMNASTFKNVKSGLINKGYLEMKKFRDENNQPMLRIVLGKHPVILYRLGLNLDITDGKIFDKLCDMFDLLDPNISKEERIARVEQANQWAIDNC